MSIIRESRKIGCSSPNYDAGNEHPNVEDGANAILLIWSNENPPYLIFLLSDL
jgi:hypothetical protein